MSILTQNNQQSMTSQQIADLVKSRHDSVKRSIERIAEKGVITLPPLVETSFKDFIGKTQRATAYVFSGEQGKRDSIIVVAQLSPEFTAALVDRWQELEAQVLPSPVHKIPQSFSEALLLAGTLQQKIEQDAPKVNAYDKLIDSAHLKSVGDVAKSIGLKSAQELNKRLEAIRAYDGRCANRVWSGWFVEQGLGEMRTTDEGYSTNKMTTKGQAWALDLFGGAK